VLVGGMGAGKSTVGWYLAKALGYGFVDLDRKIEAREKKKIADIFADKGEEHFRSVEAAEVQRLKQLRSHVVATGGGAVLDPASWEVFSTIGLTVWLNPTPAELARRLLARKDELAKRPLLADVLAQPTPQDQHKLLSERLGALVGSRASAYGQAKVVINDAFSTPEATARTIRDLLQKDGLLAGGDPRNSFDRWQVM
jgi:shikimate kinase